MLGGAYLSWAFDLPAKTIPIPPPNARRATWTGDPVDEGWRLALASADLISSIIQDQQKPLMFIGTGQWKPLFRTLSSEQEREVALPTPGPGEDSHCVVAYGVGGDFLFVTLGWGSYFSDLWIDITSFQDANVIYNILW